MENKVPEEVEKILDYDHENCWHVYPHAEEKMNILVGLDCPCNPKIEKQPNEGMVVSHNRIYTKEEHV
jgi:hypothetical protein